MYNYGYVPIPLALMLFGQETVGVLFVHNVGTETALWTVGLVLLTGASPGREWRKILNVRWWPLCWAWSSTPRAATNGFRVSADHRQDAGPMRHPAGHRADWGTMADQLHEFHSQAAWKAMGTGCLVRLVVLPLGFLVLARYLPCSVELKRVIILQAAMPAAVFPIVMSKHYGGDTATPCAS